MPIKIPTPTNREGLKNLVTFRGQSEDCVYTVDIINLLKTDPDTMQIIDGETGELLYYKGELTMSKYYIDEVYSWTEEEVATRTGNHYQTINGHTVYFGDAGGHLGYAAFVFLNGKHLYYCDEFEIHYHTHDKHELINKFVDKLLHTVYTIDQLTEELSPENYEELEQKEYYIRNYYPMQFKHQSIWCIGTDDEKQAIKNKIKNWFYSPVSFSYFENEEDKNKVEHLYNALQTVKNKNKNSVEYWENAFLHEMYNHEYNINWQGDFDVVSCFYRVEYKEEYNMIDYLKAVNAPKNVITGFRKAYAKYSENPNF